MAEISQVDYGSPIKNHYSSTTRIQMSPSPKLGTSESMPRLIGNETASRSSKMGQRNEMSNRLNQSAEMIKPLRNESSLMKIAGSSILANSGINGRSASTIEYNFKTSDPNTLAKNDPYGQISIQNMMSSEAKAQFDGVCVRYPVPDTQNKLYRVHGQVNMSLNRKPKSTYLSQIISDAKDPRHKRPGPGDYKREVA